MLMSVVLFCCYCYIEPTSEWTNERWANVAICWYSFVVVVVVAGILIKILIRKKELNNPSSPHSIFIHILIELCVSRQAWFYFAKYLSCKLEFAASLRQSLLPHAVSLTRLIWLLLDICRRYFGIHIRRKQKNIYIYTYVFIRVHCYN